jgi:hypothetical protein
MGAKRVVGGIRVVPISLGDGGSAEPDFTDGGGWALGVRIGIDDPGFDVRRDAAAANQLLRRAVPAG